MLKDTLGHLCGVKLRVPDRRGVDGFHPEHEQREDDGKLALLTGNIPGGAMGTLTPAVHLATNHKLMLKTAQPQDDDHGDGDVRMDREPGSTVVARHESQRGFTPAASVTPRPLWEPSLVQEAYALALSNSRCSEAMGPTSVPIRAVFYSSWPKQCSDVVPVGPQGREQRSDGSSAQLYLALDLAAHGDLYTWIEQFQARPTRVMAQRILPIVCDVAEVLRSFHKAGWCHRDVKPENILLDCNFRAQLGDFGFSRPIVTARNCVGTVEYHSPELWDLEKNGAEADMWALGVVLHRLLRRADPEHFDISVRLHILQRAGPSMSSLHRFEIARLGRELRCALYCGAGWKMDAQSFRRHCNTLCISIHTARILWQVYTGCLQPDARRRWTADDVCAYLHTASSSSSSATSLDLYADFQTDLPPVPLLSTIRLRPGFRHCRPPLRGGAGLSWLRSPRPDPEQRPPTAPATSAPSVGSTSSMMKNDEQQQLCIRQFAQGLATELLLTTADGIFVFQAAIEVFACLLCHVAPTSSDQLPRVGVCQLAALQLVDIVLLDDPKTAINSGLATARDRLWTTHLRQYGPDSARMWQTHIADVQQRWLAHLSGCP